MNRGMRRFALRAFTGLAALCVAGCGSTSSSPQAEAAKDAAEARALVAKARITAESMSTDPKMGVDVRSLLAKAKGVFIAPDVLRGAFIFGGSGGSGVVLARSADGKTWNGPTFNTLGAVSWGLQIGGDSSEVMLLAMTERGVTALLTNNVKLGAGASVAAGPVGGGAAAGTAGMSADILTFSRSQGAYAGLALDGAVIATRDALNDAYYGKNVSPSDVLVRGAARQKDAAPLIEALNKASAGK